jgi:thioredoxin-dependent peroxiredoxin
MMIMLNQGEPAPNVVLMLTDGTSPSVADYAGRALILYFYPKDDTSGCTKEAQEFTALASEFAGSNAVVCGVSRDSLKSHDKFAKKYDLNIVLASDESGAVCEAFGTWVEKSMYGKKYMGIERSTFLIGVDGRIAAIWRKVKVPGHAAAVLDAVKGL